MIDQKITDIHINFMKQYWDNPIYKEYLHSCEIQRFLIKKNEKKFYQYFITIQYKKEIPKNLEIPKEFENLLVLQGPVYVIIKKKINKSI